MRDVFAITKNVQRFMAGIETVNTPIRGRIGMMLAYGIEGTGKTETGQWYANQKGVPYVRCKNISNNRSLLSNIVSRMEQAPKFRSEDLFEQAYQELVDNPRVLIVDEIDYLRKDRMIETLRDLNDFTNTPIVLMGMEDSEKMLKGFRHLYDRITAIVPFELLDEAETANLARQICEVQLTDDAISFIQKQAKGKLRLTTTWLARAEKLKKLNKQLTDVPEVSASHLSTFGEKQ